MRIPDNDTSAVLRPAHARVTLVSALAWRAITEIVRRRHREYGFRLRQIHPAISVRGLLELTLLPFAGVGRAIVINFNLGGPSGTWETDGANGRFSGSYLDLLGISPATVIDQIERAAALPACNHKLPPSSDTVLALRLVAELLERKVFEPLQWRVTLALVGANTDQLADWHVHVGPRVALRADGEISSEDALRLWQMALVHEAPDECPLVEQAALRTPALAINLATGQMVRVSANAGEQLGNIRERYAEADSSIASLADAMRVRLA